MSLCCYVGIPPDSPLAGLAYDEMDAFVDVHGGFSFGGRWNDKDPNEDIPEEVRDWYWYGWDYGHGFDEMLDYGWSRDETPPPGYERFNMPSYGEARRWMLEDVIPECEAATRAISRQLAALKKGGETPSNLRRGGSHEQEG